MTLLGLMLVAVPVILFVYATAVYPALLWLIVRTRERRGDARSDGALPFITITVPAYNEERSIRESIERLLLLDYPADRIQILVISDASTDRTDEIVRGISDSRVELLRLPERRGKTAAENAAAAHARGEIIVNVDATVRIPRTSLRPLVAVFSDPAVGVASGRDVSVGDEEAEGNFDEAGYVDYEMKVRRLESELYSIIGASGCFYATRRELYDERFPEELSRDFASALIAREHGYRSVSVDQAICVVPRTRSLESELRRKIRTMARGLATLEYKRHLLNPEKYGLFAWMLISHKLCRWLFYASLPFALGGAILLAVEHAAVRVLLVIVLLLSAAGLVGLNWPSGRRVPRLFALPGFLLATHVAGVVAWWKYLSGTRQAIWEPTERSGPRRASGVE